MAYRRLNWVVIALLLPLAGCADLRHWIHNDFLVGPNYGVPVAPVSEQWIDFNDPRVISDAHGADHAAWWRTFADPNLEELIRRSFRQNLSLRAAAMRVMEAKAERGIAAGQLLPQSQQAFAQFQYLEIGRLGSVVGVPELPALSLDLWATGLNASWEIDLWGRLRRNLEASEASLDAAVEDYDDVLVSLIAETAVAYVELRAFQQRLEYARANVVAQQGSLSIAQSRFDSGLTSELDVTQARSNLAQTQALIPVLRRGARQAANRLCRLAGIPPQDLSGQLGEAEIPIAPAEVVVGIPADLVRRRPDVRQAERQVAAQSARIGVAIADLFPAFTINGVFAGLGDLSGAGTSAGMIGPGFQWKILHYGRIRNNILANDAKLQQLALQYQQKVLDATTEVEDAIVGFLESQELVRALAESVAATERSVEIVVTQYRGGVTDFNRVFNLQSSLVTQQDQLSAAQAEVAMHLIQIYRALGGGWQIRLGEPAPTTLEGTELDESVESGTPADTPRRSSGLIIPEPI